MGSMDSVNSDALDHLNITHVVSVIDKDLHTSHSALLKDVGREHLWCNIVDTETADLAPVMKSALPFIAGALSAGGRVLVHCQHGRSRSASVVVAHVMLACNLGLDEAVVFVKAQRSCVRPNEGFMQQLRERRWEAD